MTEENGEEPREKETEEEPEELSRVEIDAIPTIMCSEDSTIMEVDGTEVKEVEKRKFLFSTSTENHTHLRYVCPECGRYFLHDMPHLSL